MRFKAYNEFSEKNVDKAIADERIFFFEEAKVIGEKQLDYLKELHDEPMN